MNGIPDRTLPERILALILAAGHTGIRRSAIVAATGGGRSTCQRYTQELEKAGLVESARNGPATVWGAPGITEAWKASKDADYWVRRQKQNRWRLGRRSMGTFDDEIVQRIIPAHEAPPLRKPCPASVWELAA